MIVGDSSATSALLSALWRIGCSSSSVVILCVQISRYMRHLQMSQEYKRRQASFDECYLAHLKRAQQSPFDVSTGFGRGFVTRKQTSRNKASANVIKFVW